MNFKNVHERKIRGKTVHQTQKERKLEQEKLMEEKKLEDVLEKRYMTENGKTVREAVEATYLVPKIENFVESPQIAALKERIKRWVNLGYPVHIIGPTGCGKTTIAMQVAKELERPIAWINGDEQITTTDLIGGYSQVEAEGLRDKYVHNVFKSHDILKADWVDNPLALACKYGYTLIYNEFARSKPVANNVLLSVFEEGILELPTKFGEERYIRVHPDFAAIFTSNNVEYAGVHKPQDALLDRMIGIYMDYYDFDTEVKIVLANSGISGEEAKKIIQITRALREKLPLAEKIGTRACIMASRALENLNGNAAKQDIEQIFVDIITSKTNSIANFNDKCKMIGHIVGDVIGKNTG